MQIKYRYILQLAAPLMLGSAGQNLMVVCEGAFLYGKSEADFAAIGYVGMFYLVIMAIAFGVSRGGQVLIARRAGGGQWVEVGKTFYALFYLELFLATLVFLALQWGGAYFFSYIKDPEIYAKTLDFLKYRSYGVFFSYTGLAIVALYTGVSRPKFIFWDTLALGIINIILSYGLIFGVWGLPEMGIAGAGLAATVAEIFAFILFVGYIYFDPESRKYRLFYFPKIHFSLIMQQFRCSVSTSMQSVMSIATWFLFFMLIEKYMTVRDLAISNLVRIIYLCLSVPSWGFFTGINTLVSQLIGRDTPQLVLEAVRKTATISTLITLLLALPITLFPMQLLKPLLHGTEHYDFVQEAVPVFRVLFVNLLIASAGGVYFNGLSGMGALRFGTRIQSLCSMFYLIYTWLLVSRTSAGLSWAWLAEALYWGCIGGWTLSYMRSDKWKTLKI